MLGVDLPDLLHQSLFFGLPDSAGVGTASCHSFSALTRRAFSPATEPAPPPSPPARSQPPGSSRSLGRVDPRPPFSGMSTSRGSPHALLDPRVRNGVDGAGDVHPVERSSFGTTGGAVADQHLTSGRAASASSPSRQSGQGRFHVAPASGRPGQDFHRGRAAVGTPGTAGSCGPIMVLRGT
jgi:hypothetical protein